MVTLTPLLTLANLKLINHTYNRGIQDITRMDMCNKCHSNAVPWLEV